MFIGRVSSNILVFGHPAIQPVSIVRRAWSKAVSMYTENPVYFTYVQIATHVQLQQFCPSFASIPLHPHLQVSLGDPSGCTVRCNHCDTRFWSASKKPTQHRYFCNPALAAMARLPVSGPFWVSKENFLPIGHRNHEWTAHRGPSSSH